MSNAVGSYLRHIPNSADNDEFNQNIRRAHDGLGPVKPRSTAEQIKADFEELLAVDQARLDGLENMKSLDAFAMGHKEVSNTIANGRLLLNQANTMFGKRVHTVEHFEAAYQYLRTETDFLKIDKTVEAAKQREAAKQHFEAETARTAERAFNPNEDYSTMSLEEMRQLSDEALQADMQATGNRGGYDIG
jgi:hypothetical protein